MKNKLVTSITLFFAIYFLGECTHCKIEWDYPAAYLIQFKKQVDFQLNESRKELDVQLEINSGFTDDAYLVLYVEKEYASVLEGFKDSLKVDGFHVCSYHIPDGCSANEVPTPVDYPVYTKKTSIKKGKNSVNFKIVFPKNIASIPAKVIVSVGIVRFNEEIKNNCKADRSNFGYYGYGYDGFTNKHNCFDNYQKLFFEAFPDSSNTALAFSKFDFLYLNSILANGEAPKITMDDCKGKFQPPTYSNFDRSIIHLK